MDKRKRFLLAILTGLILSFGWFQISTGFLVLLGFIPLLFVEDYYHSLRGRHTGSAVFGYAFLAFAVWNTINTWWIWNASPAGMFVAILINSCMFGLVFLLFHHTRKIGGDRIGYFSLVIFWVFWEYYYMHGEITWPWLNLGNAFANSIQLVQWYEYTGALGGSFWILLSNIFLYHLVKHYITSRNLKGIFFEISVTFFWIVVPMLLSVVMYYTYKEKGKTYTVTVIQPNIDPYEKFVALSSEFQTNRILELAKENADSTVDYFVAPETALNNDIWLNELEQNSAIKAVRNFMVDYPSAHFIVGITAYKLFNPGEQLSATARPLGNSGLFYDSYNTAIQIDSTDSIQMYHKSMLVVGVEKMPYPQYFKFLKKLTLHLGGTFRSHATQKYRSVLRSPIDSMGVAPVICYESVFGEFVTDYLKKGAGLIFIITNDGWWGDTPGYRQHFSYARIRAVETRRSIARSANTGISGFVNQRGDVLDSVGWWQPASIKANLKANEKLTWYTRNGDYIPRLCGWLSLLSLLYVVVILLMKKRG